MDTSTKRAVFKVIRKLLRYKTVEVYFAEPSSWLAVEPASAKTVGLAAVYARVYDNAYATPEEVRCDIEKIWASCAEGGETVYQEARKAMPELRDIFRAEWDSAFGSPGNTELQTDAICQWAQPPQQASRVQGYQARPAATSSMTSIPACSTAAPHPVPVASQEPVAVRAALQPAHARLPQTSSQSPFSQGNAKGSSSLQQLQLLQLLLARQRANEQAQVQDSSLSSLKPAVGCKRAASDVCKVSDSTLHTSVSLDDLEQSLRLMDSPDSLWDHCLAKRPKLPDDEADDRLPAFWLT